MLDYFGKDAAGLKEKTLFLFDMDGTIYEDGRLFEGTLPLLDTIHARGGRPVFITNNSSRSVKDYVERLNSMGIVAEKEDFFTSAQATVAALKKEFAGKKVFCVGTESLVAELRESGIKVVTEAEDDVAVVLVGYDTELKYEKLRKASLLLRRDTAYLATNPDWACPVSFGFVPDCGAICKMLEYATGRWPRFIGKPEPDMVYAVCEKFGIPKEQTVVIGDRLYTDIAIGERAGIDSICVLTGEARAEDILSGTVKPTYTFPSVMEIALCLKRDENI